MSPKVSIITPVYDSAESIRRYLDSVLSQTLDDIEVILIDDHGTDQTIAIAHSVTDTYSGPIRFTYLSTAENRGPGAARNLGINVAKGEYLSFIDSDDVIDPDFCKLLYESAKNNDSDLCCCNLDITLPDGTIVGTRKSPYVPDGEFSGENRRNFLKNYVSYFTTYLYKKSLIDRYRILFPPTRSSEDSAMFCCVLLCCQRISQVDRSLYKYVRNDTSLSHSKNPDRYTQKLSSMETLMRVVKDQGWYTNDKEEIDFIYFKKGYMMSVFDYIQSTPHANRSVIREIRSELLRQVPDYRKNRYFREKISFRILDVIVSATPIIAVPAIRFHLLFIRSLK